MATHYTEWWNALLYMMVSGKAVRDKTSTLLEIVKEILLSANLKNQKRAVEILKESKVCIKSFFNIILNLVYFILFY